MIGIFFQPEALDVSKVKYAQYLIKIFDEEKYKDQILILVYKKNLEFIKKYVQHLKIKTFGYSDIYRKIQRARHRLNLNFLADFEKAIKKNNITFAIFPSPTDDIIKCHIPFAASFQSLGHRLNPELEETAQGKSWQKREDISSFVCKNAELIFIDSEIGKEYLKFYYRTRAEIIVLTHSISDELKLDIDNTRQKEILKKFNIKKEYVFYPAQFWPHKNHVRIVEAIRYLKDRGIDLQLVFTGSSKRIKKQYNVESIIKRIAKESDMEGDLVITGYLTNEEIVTLYKNALAMIMPQLIPEPCIPYIEAMSLGCPTIASNIPGIKELVNGAGVLVDPYSIKEISLGIKLLYFNKEKREELINRGYHNYRIIESSVSSSFSRIENITIKINDQLSS